MRTYQLYSAASQANAASATMLSPGRIVAVDWSVYLNGTADNDTATAEVSFQQTSQLATNGAVGIISFVSIWMNSGAAGTAMGQVNVQRQCNVPVRLGDVIYLNTSSGAIIVSKALLHVA